MPSRRKRRIRQSMVDSHMSYQAVVNSFADRGGQAEPIHWLIEKTAIALDEAARLVDLANEPDTNAWYRTRLTETARCLIARLAPVLGVLCDRPDAANEPGKWEPIVERGVAGLIAWVEENELSDLIGWVISKHPPRLSRPHEVALRAERVDKPPFPKDVEDRAWIKLQLVASCTRWLRRRELSSATRELMLWIMAQLELAEYVDVVTLSRTFLADDIGATAAETETAFRTLWEAGVIEPVDYLPVPARADSFHVRVALLGDNGTKYPVPYVPQSFRPGRKDGRQPAWAE
ncbi:MAG: hypothetical protein JNL21_34995 [Myxococcales bacterium]|nr:hypothetical protein [Myxococcales bacterium]